jgi:hypothetical protein
VRTPLFALIGALLVSVALPAAAQAQDATTAPSARMTVQVDIERFRQTQRGPVAVGRARAVLRGATGEPTSVTRRVTLAVQRGGRCRILRLVLQELDLTLLGLNVHLDRVDLRVTGERRGGILGRLFCALANSRVRGAQARAVASLNERLREGGKLRPMRLTVPLRAVAAQGNTCPVLDLTLGPLNLNLLGLVVELNRVRLTITAIRGGGLLGDLFCGLAGGTLPTLPIPPTR